MELRELSDEVNDLYVKLLSNEEYLLDTPFTLEEVECSVCRLIFRKASGPDDLMGEHLKLGGQAVLVL